MSASLRKRPKCCVAATRRYVPLGDICSAARDTLFDHLVITGEKRGRPSRSITTETVAKTVDQLDQHYKCSGCNPGKCPDTRRMVFASRTGSRDIAHDRYFCIAVLRSEPPQRWERRDRRHAH